MPVARRPGLGEVSEKASLGEGYRSRDLRREQEVSGWEWGRAFSSSRGCSWTETTLDGTEAGMLDK